MPHYFEILVQNREFHIGYSSHHTNMSSSSYDKVLKSLSDASTWTPSILLLSSVFKLDPVNNNIVANKQSDSEDKTFTPIDIVSLINMDREVLQNLQDSSDHLFPRESAFLIEQVEPGMESEEKVIDLVRRAAILGGTSLAIPTARQKSVSTR